MGLMGLVGFLYSDPGKIEYSRPRVHKAIGLVIELHAKEIS